MLPESTREIRTLFYWLIGSLAVGLMVGRIVGAENVVEPSRYAPPQEQSFGADRYDTPKRKWPQVRPEPSPFYGSNDRSRWATVHALVDHGTFVVGQRADHRNPNPPYQDTGIIFQNEYLSLDKVMNPETGQYYSSKPPLLTVLVAGEYWLLQKLFGWHIQRDRWHVVCTILITVNVLPFVAYLLVLIRILEQEAAHDATALVLYLLAAGATFLTTFSITLNNHGPAAYCVLFALAALMLKPKTGQPACERPGRLAIAGFFAGLAATLELPAAAFTVALFVPLMYRRPGRSLFTFVPAMLLPVLALMACNYWAMGRWLPAYSDFGGPWYNFPGSHWAKLDLARAGTWQAGIDFAQESKARYAWNLLFGHHGWFSLTPIWLLSLWGMISAAQGSLPDIRRILQNRAEQREIFSLGVVCTMTLLVSGIVLGFYILKTNNYGGNTSGPRWLFWLIPLWLIGLIPLGIQYRGKSGIFSRIVLAILLGFSTLSVYYPVWNPWRPPWIQQMEERIFQRSYEVPPNNS